MEDVPRVPIMAGRIQTRSNGLRYLEGEMLALVGVAAGLKASVALSSCCVSLRDTLASPELDEQLFGRLYASMAGVENPWDAFLQPPPRHDLNQRRQPPDTLARSSSSATDRPHQLLHLGTGKSGKSEPLSDLPSGPREPEAPATKRVRLPGRDISPPPAVLYGSLPVFSCSSCLPPGGGAGASAPAEDHKQREHGQPKTWKIRLKEDTAAHREPSETFVFAGQKRGRHDVLMAVVPSTPPLVAITCTTEMSLFSLEGRRLPVITAASRPHAESTPTRRKSSADSARGGNTGGERVGIPSQRSSAASRCARDCAYGMSADDDDDDGERHAEATGVAAEAHQRDIRCLAASPAGDMVATGLPTKLTSSVNWLSASSLDCTIRVRSVPGCDWVRRLRGHEAGVRCLAFHGTRLVSADSHGTMAVWDIFPISRKLQMVRGHSDSVQVLTLTGGGERLASGALDGSVVVWSVSAEGTLVPVVTYSGLCHPFRLVAIGRCVVFTSSAASQDIVDKSKGCCTLSSDSHDGDGDGDDGAPSLLSRGARISVVSVDPPPTCRDLGCGSVSTGLGRLQHLVAGASLGAVVLSQTECWAEDSDSSDGGGNAFLGGGRVSCRSPRLCRIVSAARVQSFEVSRAARAKSSSGPCCKGGGGGGGGVDRGALEADWVTVPRCSSAATRPRGVSSRGETMECSDCEQDIHDSNNGDGDDGDGGAFLTCAVFVGKTLFLGCDTGFIYAHRAYDGRPLYRLSMFGSVVHLVEAQGSLFAYASSGVVSRWCWRDG